MTDADTMPSKSDLRELERVLLLMILRDEGPLRAVDVANHANVHCGHGKLAELAPLSKRGMAQKLNALSLAGLVEGEIAGTDWMLWSITAKGRARLEEFDRAGS